MHQFVDVWRKDRARCNTRTRTRSAYTSPPSFHIEKTTHTTGTPTPKQQCLSPVPIQLASRWPALHFGRLLAGRRLALPGHRTSIRLCLALRRALIAVPRRHTESSNVLIEQSNPLSSDRTVSTISVLQHSEGIAEGLVTLANHFSVGVHHACTHIQFPVPGLYASSTRGRLSRCWKIYENGVVRMSPPPTVGSQLMRL